MKSSCSISPADGGNRWRRTCSALHTTRPSRRAFPEGIRGFNRPTNVRFGPDGCAYVADYAAVRDFGRSDPDTGFKNPLDAALVQIPGTGVIWKICPN